jgi:DNA helicase-2/ATP-dependent DNA helicase PcrA
MSNLQTWISSLNEEQKTVVLQDQGVSIVYAGAGSGKTRTLTIRLAYLLEQGVQAHEVLGVTFTNKAAQELSARVSELVGPKGKQVLISTFHGLCTYLFRVHHDQLPVEKNFLIYSDTDQVREMRIIVKEKGPQPPIKPELLVSYLNDFRCKGISFLSQDSSRHLQHLPLTPLEQEFAYRCFQQYERTLHQKNAYDFGRLLTFLLDCLKNDPTYAQNLSKRFRYIFVDEFQDTNVVQLELIRELAQVHRSICVVGDDDQSIYSWRGAEPKCFQTFQSWYPESKKIALEVNYRSAPEIIEFSNTLIDHNAQRHPKILRPHKTKQGQVLLVEAHHRQDEAFWVGRQIQRLRKQHPELSYKDFAILFRVNSLARSFEQACLTLDIPYQLNTGLRLFDFYENSILLSYLRFLLNQKDTTAFLETLSFPRKGWGEKSLLSLKESAEASNLPIFEICTGFANGTLILPFRLTKSALAKLEIHLDFFKQLQETKSKTSVKELLLLILKETNYQEALEKAYKFDATRRWSNVLLLLELAEKFDQQENDEPESFLENFLTQQSLNTPEQKTVDGVQLLTIHASKGLEFPCVFLVGLEENLLPLKPRLTDQRNENDHYEEERRLCYVAMTRAETYLFLSYTQLDESQYDQSMRQVSRFVEEIRSKQLLPFQRTPEADQFAKPKVKTSTFHFGHVKTADELNELQIKSASWETGQIVRHKIFGIGTILSSEGSGPQQKVIVKFQQSKKKILGRFLEER